MFSNHRDGKNLKINSYIYWGSKTGFSKTSRTELPTSGAGGNVIADLNGDSLADIAFSNREDSSTYKLNSYIYWGSTSGFSVSKRTELPTVGGAGVSMAADPGSKYQRGSTQTFFSRVMDSGSNSPTYHTLSWIAAVPKNATLKLQVRSGSSPAAVTAATWFGPSAAGGYHATSPSPLHTAHAGHRYLQYRAVFSSDFGGTPILDKVEIAFH